MSPFSTLFNLEHAVKYFDYFCKDSLPMLRIHCCSLLFHLGSNETWWSSFFPTLLKKYFGFTFLQGSKKNNDRFYIIFIFNKILFFANLLIYSNKKFSLFLCLTVLCNESVKYTHLQVSYKLKFISELSQHFRAKLYKNFLTFLWNNCPVMT